MDRILNFVALRPLSTDGPPPTTLADSSDFQQQLTLATAGPKPLDAAVAAAKALVADGRFLAKADQVNRGVELLAMYERLADDSWRETADVDAAVREAVGDLQPSDRAADATKARDSVLAGYLLGDAGPSAGIALKLVRTYAVVEAVLAGGAPNDRLGSIISDPLVLPDYLLGLQKSAETDAEAPSPADVVNGLLDGFKTALEQHSRLSQTLAEIESHDEDELVLAELGEQRPLESLYQSGPTSDPGGREHVDPKEQQQALEAERITGSSTFRRAAARANVVFSDNAVRLLSESARETLHSLSLDPATSTVQEMQNRVSADHAQTAQKVRSLSIEVSKFVPVSGLGSRDKRAIEELLGPWQVDPVDDPTTEEPVATTAPTTATKFKPLGVVDLFLVRTHISRYERGEVASLENIFGGEKLTHTVRQLTELETADTTESEQSSLQSLAQTTAEQNSDKSTAQAVGTGRGPLTSDGPQSFSKSVTDQVSSSSSNRNRKASSIRQLRRNEESVEHVFDNTTDPAGRFGVYQWLDKVYQAQVYKYDSPRLLYDIVIPEPAVVFREALARPRGQAALPPRPANFTVTADHLNLHNWSYYATGHQAAGVEAPPQAHVVVTEAFGGKAGDPFSTELSANTYEIGECRKAIIPKGYKATQYRLVAEMGGNPALVGAIIGTKAIDLGRGWGSRFFSGMLTGEVDSLPVGLIAHDDGDQPGLANLAVGIEIICEPTDEAISAWQTKTHGLILAANQRRFADYEERLANRDAAARLQLRTVSAERKVAIIQAELKRTTLAVLTNQNFSTFNTSKIDSLGFPYPHAGSVTALSAYIRFFEQAVEWDHLQHAFFPYFWGSRSSWVSKLLDSETDPHFSAFLTSGAARVVLPIRPGYEAAFERFLSTGQTPTTEEMLDVGSKLWVSLVSQLRSQGEENGAEVPEGEPWEFRLASDLIRARRDDLLPKWSPNAGDWVEQPDSSF